MKHLLVRASQARRGDLMFMFDRYLAVEGLSLLPRTDRLCLTLRSNTVVVSIFCARDQDLALRRPTENGTAKPLR